MNSSEPRHEAASRDQPIVDLRWHIWLAWAAFALVMVTATRADPDLWGHLRFGLDWLQSHRLPTIDPYSFTQDRPWVNHEWLSEACMAAAFRIAGSAGLILLKAAIVLSTASIVAWRLRGASPLFTVAVLTAVLASAMPLTGTVRPQIWSLLALTALIALLDSLRSPTSRTVWLSVLFALWANLHGGWVTGAAVLCAYGTVRAMKDPRNAYRWIVPAVVALAATALNPYGVGLWRFLAATVRAARPDVTEWRAFSLEEPAIMWVSVLLPAVVLIALSRNRRTRPPAEGFVTWGILTLAGLRVSRVAPLASPALFALFAPYMREAWGDIGRVRRVSPAAAVVFLVPLGMLVMTAAPPIGRVLRCLPVQDSWAPDLDAARYLENTSGRLWVAFDWGEYAIWHFGPALKVSIDGRRETVYSEAIVGLHRDFDAGNPAARAAFLQLAPDYVWLRSHPEEPRDWLLAHGYTVAVDTGRSFVATRRRDSARRSGYPPLSACFP